MARHVRSPLVCCPADCQQRFPGWRRGRGLGGLEAPSTAAERETGRDRRDGDPGRDHEQPDHDPCRLARCPVLERLDDERVAQRPVAEVLGDDRWYASGVAYSWSYNRSIAVDPYAVRMARPIAMPIMRETVTTAEAIPNEPRPADSTAAVERA